MQGYIGQVILWPSPRIPRGWQVCDGSPIKISDNEQLYSLIGNAFGGDGVTHFNLPDLRGYLPVGAGQNQHWNPSNIAVGQTGGGQDLSLTLGIDNLPAHNHDATFTGTANSTLEASPAAGQRDTPLPNDYVGKPAAVFNNNSLPVNAYTPDPGTPVNLNGVHTSVTGTVTVENTGNGAPLNFQYTPPFVGMNYVICVEGLYPDF